MADGNCHYSTTKPTPEPTLGHGASALLHSVVLIRTQAAERPTDSICECACNSRMVCILMHMLV